MSKAKRWLASAIKQALRDEARHGGQPPPPHQSADVLPLLDMLSPRLSPIDRHLIASRLVWKKGLFHPSYEEWRIVRINKILEIFGIDYFNGKTILELGGGHGDIGAFFAALGAKVTCLEGRTQNINYARLKHRNQSNITFEQCDLDQAFPARGTFDLILNFGLVYHLQKVETHLERCFQLANNIVLETVVHDSLDPHAIVFCAEESHVNEQAIGGVGSRPSPSYVERIAVQHGFAVNRHFTSDLNVGDQFLYDWEHQNNGDLGPPWQLRRFWHFNKAASDMTADISNASQPTPALLGSTRTNQGCLASTNDRR